MQVAIKSPSFEANVAFAERLAEESLELYYPRHDFRYFSRAEFYRDTEVLQDNALYLATESELQDIIHFLESEIDKARSEERRVGKEWRCGGGVGQRSTR